MTSLTVPVEGITYTLGARQIDIARAIIIGAHARGIGDAGARVGLMTALTESKLRMYANTNVPESLTYPHDAVGDDGHSLGPFQQQDYWWGTVPQLMDLGYTIGAFYGGPLNPNAGRTHGLIDIVGWENLDPGMACQFVQGSDYPDRYAEWAEAADLLIGSL